MPSPTRPIIGVNLDLTPAQKNKRTLMLSPIGYADAIVAAGGLPLFMPPFGKDKEIAAFLDRVHGLSADVEAGRVGRIPIRDTGIQVPAVVVEPDRRIGREPLDRREIQPLDRRKAHHHIGHLHAGVVDVVLDLDVASLEADQPSERVAGRRVAQVPDVRGLVRVDRRVLDDGLLAAGEWPGV